MDDSMEVPSSIRPENPVHRMHHAPPGKSAQDEGEKPHSSREMEKNEELPVKTEILTTTDIEIRKLHALRRAKEFLEEKLAEAGEKAVSGGDVDVPENLSPAAIAYNNHTKSAAAIKGLNPAAAAGATSESDVSFKADTAIAGYKNYKKETPKAWIPGDLDEKR